tara:strand:+ start:33490 stop:35706 length:2217 start_codon:yes stop_codon:yes gene_type:complete
MEEKAINPSAGTKKEVQIKLKNKDLKTLKLVDLKKICKEFGLKGVSNLKKDFLIDLIEKSISEKVKKKKTAEKKSSTKKSPAKKSSTKKSPVKKSTANKSSTKKSPAKKSTANKSSTKKSTAKESSIKKPTKKESYNKEQVIKENYLLKYKKFSLKKISDKLEEIIESSNFFQKNREIQDLIKLFREKINKESKKAEKIFYEKNSKDTKFDYASEFKNQYDKIIIKYRNKRKKYFKDLDNIQNINYEKKLEIIENIKKLIDKNNDNFEEKYKEFKKNKENWHLIGPVPRSKDSNIWQTFKHHVERFYDLLHLNRKFRETDFKNNYQEKLKIIESAEKLTKEKDIIKATRDINILHKKWKNELGPVEKKHRESLWKRFQSATKLIQKKRKEYKKDSIKLIRENIKRRVDILKKLKIYTEKMPNNHLNWQNRLIEFSKLKEEFKNAGYVPNKDGKLLWKNLRDYNKLFMTKKNEFYKSQKIEFKNRINQKKDLINELKSYLKSNNWDQKIELVKKNQIKWKTIGFAPRKLDNKLWKEFSNLNTLYFERFRSGYNKLDENEVKLYNSKKELITKINTLKLSQEINKTIEKIEKEIIKWTKVGELNNTINEKLNNEFSNSLINHIKDNKSIVEIKENLIFEIKLKLVEFEIDTKDKIFQSELKKEKNLINELNQLENNLEFFTNSSSENKLFKDVEKKIFNIKNQIGLINEKKKRINALKKVNEKMMKSEKSDKKENKPNKD